ncbi:MAG: O-antigen ligase family protein [Bacteroidia bacterium]|nr:O-antigen ligase family protein [Bacteroidia bacterium]
MFYYEKIKKSAGKKLEWAAFLMAYPFWVIVQNISFFVMISFYMTASRYYVKLFRVGSLMSIAAFIMIIAAIISSIGAEIKLTHELFLNTFTVLPNYIYWATLVIGIGNIGFKVIKVFELYKMIYWGVICSIISYHLFNPILDIIPLYNTPSPNSFAFTLIIFGPIATAYLYEKKKNLIYTICFILIVTLAGFMSGSRSGSILTLVGCLSVLSLKSWTNMLMVAFLGIFLNIAAPQVIENPKVKNLILNLNERTYSLIYETDETLETDRSFLTRLALIEKGMSIFKEHPITGVGIGNYTKVEFDIQFNFEGGQFLERKEESIAIGTSAHNSYINFLSEGGILLLLPIVFMMFYPIFYFITKFNQIKGIDKAIFIGIILMCIHSWFISGMLNVYAWFLVGIANSYIIYKRPSRTL